MKAAYINQTGGPEKVIIGDLPTPEPMSNEVLVKTPYAAVDYVDTFIRSGAFQTQLDFPFVIGRDVVGIIKKVGSDVTGFKIGDFVWTNAMGYDGNAGIASEYAAIPAERLFHAPKIDPVQLVASVHSSATAYILLKDILDVHPHGKILIEGAAGHIGSKLTTLSHYFSLRTSTTSNISAFEKLGSLGAGRVFDYHRPVAELHDKFDYIVDTSGKVSLSDNLNQLNLQGKIGLITVPKVQDFDIRKFYTSSQLICGFVISHARLSQLQKAASALNPLFASKLLLDDSVNVLSIKQAALAHQMMENNQTKGQKLVLKL